MSPFQFLLSQENEAFTGICKELFDTSGIRPTWTEAFDQCENYRKYLDSLPIDSRLKAKSYLLQKKDIDELLNQVGADGGIRIYIGHEPFVGGTVVRLFMVACVENGTGGFDDWHIPPRKNPVTTTILGESRPCPDECSSDNDLNRP
jgi:hypothetical protein